MMTRRQSPPGATSIVDAHVHFWDPASFEYPWLRAVPALGRSFVPRDYAAGSAPVDGLVVVEANSSPADAAREAQWFERLAEHDARIAGIVAFVDLTEPRTRTATLTALAQLRRVKGVRQNIQGQPAGFCLDPVFVDGLRMVAHQGLSFDVCATHDQLADVVELVTRCPDARFALDHCGKPPIRERGLDPWRRHIAALAARDNVWCKISGLVTEADPRAWTAADLLPYAAHVVECFGPARIMYGSDWPVLSLAADYGDWFDFTMRLTEPWTSDERRAFYRDTAVHFYRL
jgi:L-fuconolactonase